MVAPSSGATKVAVDANAEPAGMMKAASAARSTSGNRGLKTPPRRIKGGGGMLGSPSCRRVVADTPQSDRPNKWRASRVAVDPEARSSLDAHRCAPPVKLPGARDVCIPRKGNDDLRM